MKMEFSGLRLGRMEYEMMNWTVGSQMASVSVDMRTGGCPEACEPNSASVRLDTRRADVGEAERFHAWLTENKGRTFKVTLELDDEDEEAEE